MMRRAAAIVFILCATACSGEVVPAAVTTSDVCANCRMTVLNPQFAAQVVAPGEDAMFFDDIGCLAKALASGKTPSEGIVFVTDHRTREWVRAQQAVFTHVPAIQTPMGSHLIAHQDAESRQRDAAAQQGTVKTLDEAIPSLATGARDD